MTTILEFLGRVWDAITGARAKAAADEVMAGVRRELDRERKTTASLRLLLVVKERRIRALEAQLAERDPGALLDGVFGGPASGETP